MSPGTAVLFGFGATLGLRYSTLKALNAECSDICCHLSLPFVFTVSEVLLIFCTGTIKSTLEQKCKLFIHFEQVIKFIRIHVWQHVELE